MSSHQTSTVAAMAYYLIEEGFKCLILGHQQRLATNSISAIGAAVEMGANPHKICILHVPSGPQDPGFKLIQVAEYKYPVTAEGVILMDPYSAAILQTADCPTIILIDDRTGKMVITHAGRAALTPTKPECGDCTIVTTALVQLGAADLKKVRAHVIGDICGKCFLHDTDTGRPLVEPFRKLGEKVFQDWDRGGVSLFAVIKHRLMHAGVLSKHITHSADCTYEKSQYASHRRDKNRDDRNHVIVVKTK